MTREEHVQWARRRAHEYVDGGNGMEAFASMLSDLHKHEETVAAAGGCFIAGMAIDRTDSAAVRRWIDSCLPGVPLEDKEGEGKMLTYIVVLDGGFTQLMTSQEIRETDEALEFWNGQKLVGRFVAYQGWKLLGHVS